MEFLKSSSKTWEFSLQIKTASISNKKLHAVRDKAVNNCKIIEYWNSNKYTLLEFHDKKET